MKLELHREPSVKGATFGQLYVDGQIECFTLEDQIRPAGEKVFGETAIPAGTYAVTLENSPRFGPDTLTVNAVPGFDGVRMHGGNKKEDTEGCVLVGDHIDRNAMTISGAQADNVLAHLKAKVKAALDAGHTVALVIVNPKAY